MDITFHYPPELFELLINGIPLLCRSKKSTLLFFEGAGVPRELFEDLWEKVELNKDTISKFEIVRTILTRINQQGERTLHERREILKRVVEFDDFSVCWPDNEYKAKGIVSDIRRIVDGKDTITKIKQELEKERLNHQSEHLAHIQEIQRKQAEREKIKIDLFSLFSIPDSQSQRRGKFLEGVLNRLFTTDEIIIREAFEVVKEPGEGITEQIDGVIEIDGYIYLVEMKWWKDPLGKKEISPHLVNIFNRGHAGGIIISNSGFTHPAIETCKEALTQKIIVLCELEEMVILLEQKLELKDFFKAKIRTAVTEKNPLSYPLKERLK